MKIRFDQITRDLAHSYSQLTVVGIELKLNFSKRNPLDGRSVKVCLESFAIGDWREKVEIICESMHCNWQFISSHFFRESNSLSGVI